MAASPGGWPGTTNLQFKLLHLSLWFLSRSRLPLLTSGHHGHLYTEAHVRVTSLVCNQVRVCLCGHQLVDAAQVWRHARRWKMRSRWALVIGSSLAPDLCRHISSMPPQLCTPPLALLTLLPASCGWIAVQGRGIAPTLTAAASAAVFADELLATLVRGLSASNEQ
jgi:hypothetical protein